MAIRYLIMVILMILNYMVKLLTNEAVSKLFKTQGCYQDFAFKQAISGMDILRPVNLL